MMASQSPRGRLTHRIGAAALALTLLTLAACSFGGQTTSPTPTATPAATATTAPTATKAAPTATTGGGPYKVLVYFGKHPDTDNNPALVFPVTRYSPTLGVATYAIQQLIAGPTPTESAQNYYSPIQGLLSGASNCGGADFTITLDHKGSTPATGYATLKFCRAVTLAGDLSGAPITSAITATLKQFPNIQHVVILNQSGNCFDDLSGQNLCLQ